MDPQERERLITAKQDELQKVFEAHQAASSDPTQGIAFDPGNDPIMQEAVLRLIEGQAKRELEAQGVSDDAQLREVMAKFREEVASMTDGQDPE